jgi:hypothetical protein
MMKKFQFVDFQPNTVLVDRAMEKLSRVFGESPSDSSTIAMVRKTAEGFVGKLHIRSAVGEFFADVIGEDPFEVVDDLSCKVRDQLFNWKRSRDFDAE